LIFRSQGLLLLYQSIPGNEDGIRQSTVSWHTADRGVISSTVGEDIESASALSGRVLLLRQLERRRGEK